MPDTSKPAFPTPTPFSGEGMSLRDHFAGLALNAIISNPSWNSLALAAIGFKDSESPKIAAVIAYHYADAMLTAREG